MYMYNKYIVYVFYACVYMAIQSLDHRPSMLLTMLWTSCPWPNHNLLLTGNKVDTVNTDHVLALNLSFRKYAGSRVWRCLE